ncbi:hypothetical protein HYW60_03225 [Candidatus Kaiserbacteria bacterium]|nr:hypothetical protein [Candidatus Kaiserbacteria bacterium]
MTLADTEIEAALVDALKGFDKRIPILSEEEGGTPDIDLGSAIQTGLFSIDPLDGTTLFAAGLPDWSTSVCYFEGGGPRFAIVSQPGFGRCFVAERGEGIMMQQRETCWLSFQRTRSHAPMIGLDLPRSMARSRRYWPMARKLIIEFGYPRNEPSVFSGVELMLGLTWMWFTASIAKHWDPAAGSLFIEECGGVAECLNGSSIPWHKLEMPPLLFAESADAAARVRAAIK